MPKLSITGKGMTIWVTRDCEKDVHDAIIAETKDAKFSHLNFKVANGVLASGIDEQGVDHVKHLIELLREAIPGIKIIGWHYVFGDNPTGEAAIAIQRCNELALDAYAIDAEREYKGKNLAAVQFTTALRSSLFLPIGLYSYRYPSLHPELPWKEFRARCDFDMPQVYWQDAHNPDVQLEASWTEFSLMTPKLDYLPCGSAYRAGDWVPTAEDINKFSDKAVAMGLPGITFWEWGRTRMYAEQLWPVIKAYDWPSEEPMPLPKGIIVTATNNVPVRLKAGAGKIIGIALTGWRYIPSEQATDINGNVWYCISPGWIPATATKSIEV